MISINVPKQDTKEKEPEKSNSQKNLLRSAKEDSEKKMTVEKAARMKRAGLTK